MFRRRRPDPDPEPVAGVDVGALDPRWRAPVAQVVAARSRFRDLLARAPDGPLRDRLLDLGERVDAGALAAWATARRAQVASSTLAGMGVEQAGAALKEARRRRAAAGDAGAAPSELARLDAEVELLSARFASLNRLWNGLEGAEDRLRLVELRVEAVVAAAAELLLGGAPAGADRAAEELDGAAAELTALQAALAELPGPSR